MEVATHPPPATEQALEVVDGAEDNGNTASEPHPDTKIAALARQLKVELPKGKGPVVSRLVFTSSWVEKSTKRSIEVAYKMSSERFQITLDKDVQMLKIDMKYTHYSESYLNMVAQDMKLLECHLHEKFSDNQHARSLELPNLQCWDLHVGARLNIFGRPTTLMTCSLRTGQWLSYYAGAFTAIQESIERQLRKYEQVPLKPSISGAQGELRVRLQPGALAPLSLLTLPAPLWRFVSRWHVSGSKGQPYRLRSGGVRCYRPPRTMELVAKAPTWSVGRISGT